MEQLESQQPGDARMKSMTLVRITGHLLFKQWYHTSNPAVSYWRRLSGSAKML